MREGCDVAYGGQISQVIEAVSRLDDVRLAAARELVESIRQIADAEIEPFLRQFREQHGALFR